MVPPDDFRLFLIAVRNRLDGFCRPAAQGVHFDDIAAAHVGEQRTDRDLLRGNSDVDAARLHEI